MSQPQTLASRYAAIVCDLDGVAYRGPAAVPHAIEALAHSTLPVIYATTNASRTPEDVAAHLRDLGLPCAPGDVATSSQAGAGLVADNVPPGSGVLAVGGPGVSAALVTVWESRLLPQLFFEVALVLCGQGLFCFKGVCFWGVWVVGGFFLVGNPLFCI